MINNNKRQKGINIIVAWLMLINSIYLASFMWLPKPNHYSVEPRLDSLIKKSIPLIQFRPIFGKGKIL